MSEKKKQRAKTNLEKMGFADLDIYTAAHDRICQWLRTEENLKKVLIQTADGMDLCMDALKQYIQIYSAKYIEEMEKWLQTNPLKVLDVKILSINPEYVVEREKFVAGFVDLKVCAEFTISFPAIYLDASVKINAINSEIDQQKTLREELWKKQVALRNEINILQSDAELVTLMEKYQNVAKNINDIPYSTPSRNSTSPKEKLENEKRDILDKITQRKHDLQILTKESEISKLIDQKKQKDELIKKLALELEKLKEINAKTFKLSISRQNDCDASVVESNITVTSNVYFEVKSSFQSIGALEREMNYYQTQLRHQKIGWFKDRNGSDIRNDIRELSSGKSYFVIVTPPKPDFPDVATMLKQTNTYYIECPAELVTDITDTEMQKQLKLEERITALERQVRELQKSKNKKTMLEKFVK